MSYKIYHNCYSCRYECWMFSSKVCIWNLQVDIQQSFLKKKQNKTKRQKKKKKQKNPDLDITHRLWIQFQ